MNDYATHIPLLAAAVALTDGPVLELGCGDYSTYMLNQMCRGRSLTSTDEKREWAVLFTALESGRHKIVWVPDWDLFFDSIAPLHYSVIFVDHAPGERRKDDIDRLRNAGDLLVIHDTEAECYGYEPVLKTFPFRFDYTLLRPHTTVVSMCEHYSKQELEQMFGGKEEEGAVDEHHS
jgi:hypothetical protein